MPRMTSWLVAFVIFAAPLASGADSTADREAVDRVLTSFHRAAAEADGKVYFSLMADDAIYLGTDASERWTLAEFKAFADPYFSEGRGWTYTTRERHIHIASGAGVAWFDEMLWNEAYGTCRGTGVLVQENGTWRIAQYHLTFPIPNELSREFTARIKEHTKASETAN